METVLLVIHVLISLALIGMVLIQRSESDGFGLGSGGGSNFMSGRATANFLTRTTAILATLFIVNSLVLGIIASSHSSTSIVDKIKATSEDSKPTVPADDAKSSDTKKAKADEDKESDSKEPKEKSQPSVPTEQ